MFSLAVFSQEATFEELYELSLNTVYHSPQESLSLLKKAEAIAFDKSDKAKLAKCYWAMGYVYQLDGDVVNSKRFYFGALKIFRVLANLDGQIQLLENIGTLSLDHGLAKSAHRFYEERYGIAKHAGDFESISDAFYDLGLSSRGMYQYDSALQYFSSSLSYAKRAGLTKNSESEICNQIGITCMTFGFARDSEALIDSARAYLIKAIDLSETPVNKFRPTNNLGNLYKLEKNYVMAEKWLIEASRLGARIESDRLLLPTLNNLGTIYYELGDYDLSDSLFNKAVEYNLKDGTVEDIIRDQELKLSFDNVNEGILSIKYLDSLSRKMPLSDMKSDMIARLNSEHFERRILEFRDMESTMAMELDLVEQEMLKLEEKASVMNVLMIVTFAVLGLFIVMMVSFVLKGKAKALEDEE